METALPIALENFIATKKSEGKSPHTTAFYTKCIGHFTDWLGSDNKLRHLTLNNARAFIAHLQERGTKYEQHPITPKTRGSLSPYTIHGHV